MRTFTIPRKSRRWAQGLALGVMALTFVASPMVPDAKTRPPSRRVQLWVQQNAIRAACMENARNLAGLIVSYSRNNQGRLPDMTSPGSLQEALAPYANDPSIFYCPAGAPYRGNPALSEKTVQSIPNFAGQMLVTETRTVHVGGRVTVLGDGRVVFR